MGPGIRARYGTPVASGAEHSSTNGGEPDAPFADGTIAYADVDAQPHTDVLVAGMDSTSAWPAVQRLRAWERERLGLRPGERVLDVGCGPGDVLVALSSDVGPSGTAIGVDQSEAMLRVAQSRAGVAGSAAEFRRGNAAALEFADDSFDACRAERVLQWLSDPAAAVAELARVVRPGGRMVLTDTDWRSLLIDLPDRGAADLVMHGVLQGRGASAEAGGRLVNLCREAGLVDIECSAQTQTRESMDPEAMDMRSGFFPVRIVVPQMAAAGAIPADQEDRVIGAFVAAAAADRLFMAVTMFAVYGRRPSA